MSLNASPTMQRYAAEIYRHQVDAGTVRLTDIVDHIGASPQAVSKMIQKMKTAGYLNHEPYRGVQLTAAGEKIAMPALRRHRLAEVFLVKVMNYDWASAHDLTDSFELGVNDELEDRMDELTGFPTHCPHGEPIPDKDGNITYPDDHSLSQAESNTHWTITRVRTHDLDKLRYLASLKFTPGTNIFIRGCAPFKGPLRIEVDGKVDQIIGYELASVLWVTPR